MIRVRFSNSATTEYKPMYNEILIILHAKCIQYGIIKLIGSQN